MIFVAFDDAADDTRRVEQRFSLLFDSSLWQLDDNDKYEIRLIDCDWSWWPFDDVEQLSCF